MFRHQIDNHLSLRMFRLEDSEELYATVEANRKYLREWLPWLDSNTSVDETRAFIRSTLEQHAKRAGSIWGIWYDSRIAGVAGYHPIDWLNKGVELGYWLDEGHTRKGIVTRCCKTLIDHAFGVLGLNRVMIRVAKGNTRSQAVAERLGMRQEGVLREAQWLYDHYADQIVYAVLSREWQAGKRHLKVKQDF